MEKPSTYPTRFTYIKDGKVTPLPFCPIQRATYDFFCDVCPFEGNKASAWIADRIGRWT